MLCLLPRVFLSLSSPLFDTAKAQLAANFCQKGQYRTYGCVLQGVLLSDPLLRQLDLRLSHLVVQSAGRTDRALSLLLFGLSGLP